MVDTYHCTKAPSPRMTCLWTNIIYKFESVMALSFCIGQAETHLNLVFTVNVDVTIL